jgi:hypothetical protein
MVDHQGKTHSFSPLAQLSTGAYLYDGREALNSTALRNMRSFNRGIKHHKKFSIALQILDSSRRF